MKQLIVFVYEGLSSPVLSGALRLHYSAGKVEGVRESGAKLWLAGKLPVFWSIGRLGATALVPSYRRAPFGS